METVFTVSNEVLDWHLEEDFLGLAFDDDDFTFIFLSDEALRTRGLGELACLLESFAILDRVGTLRRDGRYKQQKESTTSSTTGCPGQTLAWLTG